MFCGSSTSNLPKNKQNLPIFRHKCRLIRRKCKKRPPRLCVTAVFLLIYILSATAFKKSSVLTFFLFSSFEIR